MKSPKSELIDEIYRLILLPLYEDIVKNPSNCSSEKFMKFLKEIESFIGKNLTLNKMQLNIALTDLRLTDIKLLQLNQEIVTKYWIENLLPAIQKHKEFHDAQHAKVLELAQFKYKGNSLKGEQVEVSFRQFLIIYDEMKALATSLNFSIKARENLARHVSEFLNNFEPNAVRYVKPTIINIINEICRWNPYVEEEAIAIPSALESLKTVLLNLTEKIKIESETEYANQVKQQSPEIPKSFLSRNNRG